MAKIFTKQHNDLNFGRRKTLWKSTITFNDRIDDGHIEFPMCWCSRRVNGSCTTSSTHYKQSDSYPEFGGTLPYKDSSYLNYILIRYHSLNFYSVII
jgi:hypothetical protein